MIAPDGSLETTFTVPTQLGPNDYLVDVIDDAALQTGMAVFRVDDPVGLQVIFEDNFLVVSFQTILNVPYVIQYTYSLNNPNWVTLETITGTGFPAAFTALPGSQPLFFRYMNP